MSSGQADRRLLRTNRVHLRLDFFHTHRLAGLLPDLADHLEETSLVPFQAQLTRYQRRDPLGIEQTGSARLFGHFLRQVQFDDNAQKLLLAEGAELSPCAVNNM